MCFTDFIKSQLFPQRKHSKKVLTNYERFLLKPIPIIMVMGPSHCGKTTMAEMLATCSQFDLIKLKDLYETEVTRRTILGDKIAPYLSQNKPVPDDLTVKLLKDEIISTYVTKKGFIIDGFPRTLKEAVLFKIQIRKPDVIIYMYLSMDALFSRMVAKCGGIDLEVLRVKYIKDLRKTESVYNKFYYMTFKIFDSYPPEHTCNKIIEHLEDNHGFKLARIDV